MGYNFHFEIIQNNNGNYEIVRKKFSRFYSYLSYNFNCNTDALKAVFGSTIDYSEAIFAVRKDLHVQFVDDARKNLNRAIDALTKLGIGKKPDITTGQWGWGLDENEKRLPNPEWLVVYKYNLENVLNDLKDINPNYILFADLDDYVPNLGILYDIINSPDKNKDLLLKRAFKKRSKSSPENSSENNC